MLHVITIRNTNNLWWVCQYLNMSIIHTYVGCEDGIYNVKDDLNRSMSFIDFHCNIRVEGWFVYRICVTCRKKVIRCRCTRFARNIIKTHYKKCEVKYYFDVELINLIDIIEKNIVININILTSFSYLQYTEQIKRGVQYPNITCRH